jgi:hypothetical protein
MSNSSMLDAGDYRLLHNRNNNQNPIAKPRITTATI